MRGILAAGVVFAFVGADLIPQGSLVRAGSEPLRAVVQRHNAFAFTVYIPGWRTSGPVIVGTPPLDFGGAAIGEAGSSVIRTVAESRLVDDGGGLNMAAGPLFPYLPSSAVSNSFWARDMARAWFGFQAAITAPVPDFRSGTLAFHLELHTGKTYADPRNALLNSTIGVAETNAAGMIIGTPIMLQPTTVARAEILDYRFDRGTGNYAVNYAEAGVAPSTGAMIGVGQSAWGPGQSGSGLAARPTSNSTSFAYCDTGWVGGYEGHGFAEHFTVAWFMHQQHSPVRVSTLFSMGSFRCFTGGAAGSGLLVLGTGDGLLRLTRDVQTLAASNWVHVALVVDGGSNTGTWYVDGVAEPAIPLLNAVQIDAGTDTFKIGTDAAFALPSAYRIDDFRFTNGITNAAAIADWASGPQATARSYGRSCGCLLRHRNGPPTLGNNTYAMEVLGPPSQPFAVFFGPDRQIGGLPLPFDFGLYFPHLSGCLWYSSMLVSRNGVTDATGSGLISFRIPNVPIWKGALFTNQAALIDASAMLRISNPDASSIQ